MAVRKTIRERIVDTSLGSLKVTLTRIDGFDVDDIVGMRTRSQGVKRRLLELGKESNSSNNNNTAFPTDFIATEEQI